MRPHSDGANQVEMNAFRPKTTQQTFLLRVWREGVSDCWTYTVVIPDVEKRHHFHTLTDVTTFIGQLIQQKKPDTSQK